MDSETLITKEQTALRKKRNYARWHLENKKFIRYLKINGCAICGYNKCDSAMDFHHTNPKDKKFNITTPMAQRKDLIDEINKCILLCVRCHREIHAEENKNATK